MKAQLSIGPVWIRFQYTICQKDLRKGNSTVTVDQKCTTCTLSTTDKKEISSATISKHFRDTDSKPLARKLTFSMAVDDYRSPEGDCFSREDKKLLWDKFLLNVRLK